MKRLTILAALLLVACAEEPRYQSDVRIDGLVIQTDTKTGQIRTCRPHTLLGETNYVCSEWREPS